MGAFTPRGHEHGQARVAPAPLHAGCADFRWGAVDHANPCQLPLLRALTESQTLHTPHGIIAAYTHFRLPLALVVAPCGASTDKIPAICWSAQSFCRAQPSQAILVACDASTEKTLSVSTAARSICGAQVPETAVAYQILALNIEKAHNLRERAIGVVRMYRDLVSFSDGKEEDWALEFEEPALVTLGFAYQKRLRLSGGAYHPLLRKTDAWMPGRLRVTAEKRESLADALLALDDAAVAVVAALKERGFTSPYLKTFVVARMNPLRFIKGELPSVATLLASTEKRARGMKVDTIRREDIARTGGAPMDEGE